MRQLDESLSAMNAPSIPKGGWVKTIRALFGMTQKQLAKRLSVSSNTVGRLERRESSGEISLQSLASMADALGCHVAYQLVPKTSLEDFVSKHAYVRADQLITSIQASGQLDGVHVESETFERLVHDLSLQLVMQQPHKIWESR